MREIDFLPSWYPQIQKRYRWLVAQAWVTITIVVLLSSYALLKRYQVHCAKSVTSQCEARITQSRQQLAQLGEMLKYESQLRQQDQIVARLGLGVDTTRLLRSLEDAMPTEMSLTNISVETLEQARPGAMMTVSARNNSAGNGKTDVQDVDRRLKVLVDGVAPTDMQAATLVENLLKVNCFENVAFVYFREGHSHDGRVMREFEITFDINLDPPADGKP